MTAALPTCAGNAATLYLFVMQGAKRPLQPQSLPEITG